MSKNPTQGKVSLSELLARAEEIKQYLESIQAKLGELTTQLGELQLVRTTLNELPDDGGEGYVVTDRLAAVYIPVVIPEDWHKRILVNIGLTYYVQLEKNKALEIIDKRLNNTRRVYDALNRQYAALLNEYNTIQQTLTQIYAQALRKGSGEKQ